jgi:hypothetical protein
MPLIIPGFVGAYCRIIAMKDCPIKTVLTLIAIGVALNMSVKINPSDLKMMCDFRLAKREWLLTYETTNNLDKTNHSGFRPIYPDPIPADFQSKLDYLRDHRLNFYADGAVDPLFRP